MAAGNRTLFGAVGAVALLGLAACGAQSTGTSTAANATECIDIADGTFYVVREGRLVSTTQPEAEIIEKMVAAPVGWSDEVEGGFANLGFPWMGLRARDGVATLTGLAPDIAAKERAFAAGEKAVMDHPVGGRQVTLVVDGIAVEGGEAGVGESLAELSDSGLSLADCQTAFNDTMNGRNVQFQTNSANISPASARLLDAVTGVARLCNAYSVEIGGHTDMRGSDDLNQRLSQDRADAVRNYLIERGVEPEELVAVGYGESRPIDPATTYEAYAKNRRTEFIVTERN